MTPLHARRFARLLDFVYDLLTYVLRVAELVLIISAFEYISQKSASGLIYYGGTIVKYCGILLAVLVYPTRIALRWVGEGRFFADRRLARYRTGLLIVAGLLWLAMAAAVVYAVVHVQTMVSTMTMPA